MEKREPEQGILILNDMDKESNPAFESHDPSMMWDPAGRAYYSYCTDSAVTSVPPLGIPVRRSSDLVHFTCLGTALSAEAVREARDNGEGNPPVRGFWAPYVEYVPGLEEYRMYYSATRAFGSSESRIYLATAKSPEGPFENRGVAADTWGTDDTYPNAIDPHVIWDGENVPWMVYGSFFGGIYVKRLDAGTGLPVDGPRALGVCIARKGPGTLDGPEGAAVIFHPETGWYYLFLSYGWLGDDYDIRCARSRRIEGPYVDCHGWGMVGETMGMKLAGSYRFEARSPRAVPLPDRKWEWGGFRGPGHGVPFYAPEKRAYFFVHHIRDGAEALRRREKERDSYLFHYLMIRRMVFIDGWPALCPEPYTGEDFQPLEEEKLNGEWELIRFPDEDNGQQLSRRCSLRWRLAEEADADGAVYDVREETIREGIVRGKAVGEEAGGEPSGEKENGDSGSPEAPGRPEKVSFRAVALACEDIENGGKRLCCMGYDDSGVSYWGKMCYTSTI